MRKGRSLRWMAGTLLTLSGAGVLAWLALAPGGECIPELHAVVIEAHVHEGRPYSVQMLTTEFLEKPPVIALYAGDEPANGCESHPRSALAIHTLDKDAGWFHVKAVTVPSLDRIDVTLATEAEAVAAEREIHVDWPSAR